MNIFGLVKRIKVQHFFFFFLIVIKLAGCLLCVPFHPKPKQIKNILELNLAFKITRSFKCSIDVCVFCNLILEGVFFGDLNHVYIQ